MVVFDIFQWKHQTVPPIQFNIIEVIIIIVNIGREMELLHRTWLIYKIQKIYRTSIS